MHFERAVDRPAVIRPDGNPLRVRGYTTIVFSLARVEFRHRFLIVDGAPMLLLGNDFLGAHAACINLSAAADGDSCLTLTAGSRRIHTSVSTRPRSTEDGGAAHRAPR